MTRILKYEMRTKGFISVSFACVRHYNGMMRLVSKICAVSECVSVRRLDIERMLNCFCNKNSFAKILSQVNIFYFGSSDSFQAKTKIIQ